MSLCIRPISSFIRIKTWGLSVETTFARERYFLYFGSSLFSLCVLWRCWGNLSVITIHPGKGHIFLFRLGFGLVFFSSLFLRLRLPAEAASWLANSYFLRSLNLDSAVLAYSACHLWTLRRCFGRWTTLALQFGTGHGFFSRFPSFLTFFSLHSSFASLSSFSGQLLLPSEPVSEDSSISLQSSSSPSSPNSSSSQFGTGHGSGFSRFPSFLTFLPVNASFASPFSFSGKLLLLLVPLPPVSFISL